MNKKKFILIVSTIVVLFGFYKIYTDVLPYFIHFGPEIKAPTKRMVVKVPEKFFPSEYLEKNSKREVDPDILYVEDKNVKEPTEAGYEGDYEKKTEEVKPLEQVAPVEVSKQPKIAQKDEETKKPIEIQKQAEPVNVVEVTNKPETVGKHDVANIQGMMTQEFKKQIEEFIKLEVQKQCGQIKAASVQELPVKENKVEKKTSQKVEQQKNLKKITTQSQQAQLPQQTKKQTRIAAPLEDDDDDDDGLIYQEPVVEKTGENEKQVDKNKQTGNTKTNTQTGLKAEKKPEEKEKKLKARDKKDGEFLMTDEEINRKALEKLWEAEKRKDQLAQDELKMKKKKEVIDNKNKTTDSKMTEKTSNQSQKQDESTISPTPQPPAEVKPEAQTKKDQL